MNKAEENKTPAAEEKDTKSMVVDGRKFVSFPFSFNDPWEAQDIELDFAFSKPTKTQIKRLSDKASRNPTQASRDLLLGCIHPDEKEKLITTLEEYPGIATSYSGALIKGVGIAVDLGN